MKFPVLVIGAGVAGLTTAITLAKRGRDVVVLMKSDLEESNSFWAQGGVAAAWPPDRPEAHAQDTLVAARGLADLRAVEVLTRGARDATAGAWSSGVFAGSGDAPDFGREAGHGCARILQARDGFTGRALTRWLYQKAVTLPTLNLRRGRAVALIREDKTCRGAWVLDGEGNLNPLWADAVVLATGGFAGLFPVTSNPSSTTGDGLWLAYDAGAWLADLEFVQFHPTVLKDPGGPPLLLTEALRGAGAWLLNAQGQRILKDEPGAELAPRDVVARAVFREQTAYLSLAHCPRTAVEGFAALREALSARGYDLAHDALPVQAAAHFAMGGVATDLNGQTSVAGLWAVGEVAAVGVHGANRLASNSMLEGLVFGRRVGQDILLGSAHFDQSPPHLSPPSQVEKFWSVPPVVRDTLGTYLGVCRSGEGLEGAAIRGYLQPGRSAADQIGTLVLNAARIRRESRGAHFRTDYPAIADGAAGHWYHHRQEPSIFVAGSLTHQPLTLAGQDFHRYEGGTWT